MPARPKCLGVTNDETYPNLSDYVERLVARPACDKAFKA